MSNEEFIEYNKIHGNGFESLYQLGFLWRHTVYNYINEGMSVDKAMRLADRKYSVNFISKYLTKN